MSLMDYTLHLIISLVAQVAVKRRKSLPAANAIDLQRLSHNENPHFLALIPPHRKKIASNTKMHCMLHPWKKEGRISKKEEDQIHMKGMQSTILCGALP
ncbi:hypothetical protein PoB_007282300 [Plakobranchus ocellatus]|uniref:Uncharacterized protein n=1 Tax=Plakobranchus ocellatus TaxID=259542 RepID=A0AAV4DPS3_9GAST|nr:hypothetical protein PoB_007282300 [Plakobranchus ocellatus]